MRGSQFLSVTLTEAMAAERKFKRHKDNVERLVKTGLMAGKDELVEASDKLVLEYNEKAEKAKHYQAARLHLHQDLEHKRLVGKFKEIARGRHLSVGRHQFEENQGAMKQSPVLQEHSLNQTAKKLKLREISRQNGMLMSKIEKPNNTVRNADLKKRWQQNLQL